MRTKLSCRNIRLSVAAAGVAGMLLFPGRAFCATINLDDQVAGVSSASVMPFVVAGEASLLLDGAKGKQEALQGAKALLATGLATGLLKLTVREKRPNSDSISSFPSGHTAEAFAMATVLADYHPRYKWLAYGAASAVAWSRVETGEHRWWDVLAGAALGHYIAHHFSSKHISVGPGGVQLQWEW